MYKVVGYSHKQGSFVDESGKNVIYDNMIVYFVSDELATDGGCYAGSVKAKNDTLSYIGVKSLSEAIGKECLLVMDVHNPKYLAKVVVL